MQTTLFSIVIANYNYGRFLEDAIKSVIAQGMGDQVELIICDAASTDNSVDVIRKYANGLPPNILRSEWQGSNSQLATPNSKLISWWCSEKDGGQSAAFNKGFAHARGKYLTWLNADDVFFPGALKSISKVIERYPDGEWFVGSTAWVDKNLRIKHVFTAHRFSVLRGHFACATACGPSSFFTKRLLDSAGGIDETMHYAMDIDLWHKFFRKCHVRYHRTTAMVWAYRIHEDSKLSGADVSTSEKALQNRARANAEGKVLAQRYPSSVCWFRPYALLFSFSVFDKIRSLCLTKRLKGLIVNEC